MWKPVGGSRIAVGPAGPRPAAAAAAVTCLLLTGMLLLTGGHPGGATAAESPSPGAKVFSTYFKRLTREKRAAGGPPRSSAPPGPLERLSAADLFIAVKTTGRYHRQRLELLLDTWISRSLPQTYVFTDGEDEGLRRRMGSHLINTNCSAAHNRQALSCKMALEYDAFINSGKKWFCHVDDDNYLNVGPLLELLSRYSHSQDVYIGRPSLERPIEATEKLHTTEMKQARFWFATGGAGFCLSRGVALKMKPWASDGAFMTTAEHIRLPDDCTVGYIVEALLGASLTRCPLFHSHLENLALVSDINKQVTLSYGTMENSRNTVNVKGPFSVKEDPTSDSYSSAVSPPYEVKYDVA
ncbi:beta-1,3-N-acetylglucosaminyltransferase lunatic fringe-like isoform X2 [Salarias fasciatus]|uniref:beta-1,3-N-acetylglucosaminyltransferase lunatic fringe-like isoform X2 n=1 Tax=Salarias fasciatus TaxID=181472 RepID=UPI00117674A2|nr:beta-1,3-N-acetylglucosaminyltransferase lunatic fringe-like isoform X2 [Salarias fasciatus]